MKTLKYAWRFLMRSKSYTIINLFGLAFSLAFSIILIRYIHRELTVDTHCIDREQVYGVKANVEQNAILRGVIRRMGDSVLIDQRHIDLYTRVIPIQNNYLSVNNNYFPVKAIATDSVYFRLFHYPVIQGNVALRSPQSAVLTESLARKLFGKENPVGKVIRYAGSNDITVEGIIREPENKTLMQFDLVLSTALSPFWAHMTMPIEFYSFMPGTDLNELNRIGSIPRYMEDPASGNENKYTFSFIPVKQIYWDNSLIWEEPLIFCTGTYSHLLILSGVCLLLLLTGVLNFINLYLVSMLRRGKEYGLKKVFGAEGKILFLQIWLENIVLIGIALVIAWFIIEISTIPIERWFGYRFGYTTFDWQLTLGIGILLPLLTSVYPFIKYNYASPITSIRSINHGNESVRSRFLFLGIQYMVTFLLVVLSLYFNKQLNVLLHTDPGFRTKDIIIAHLTRKADDYNSYTEEGSKLRRERIDALNNELSACPDIEVWESNHDNILQGIYTYNFMNNKGETIPLGIRRVSPDFFRIFDIKIIEGNLLDKDRNSYWNAPVVVSRAALKALHYNTYLGASIIPEAKKEQSPYAELHPIAGVVDDYYTGHLTMGKRPIVYVIDSECSGDVYQIACVPGKTKEVLEFLRKLELKIYGNNDLDYSMLEDDVRAMYSKDRQVATIYSIFACIAIAISCLGLFGISLFDIRQRYREIAIRKVNGAQLKDLYPLLIRKYMIVLGCAFLLAVPIAYTIINKYTQEFIVKIPIGAGIFVIGLLVVTFISLGTLFWQIRKAAHIDPAKIIKNE